MILSGSHIIFESSLKKANDSFTRKEKKNKQAMINSKVVFFVLKKQK